MVSHIEVTNFTKKFGSKKAVDSLSFSVNKGELFAFLGANGSGKTTTIRALLGIYEPTDGSLHINGRPYNQTMSSELGYLPEERGLYMDSTAEEILTYFGELKGLSRKIAEKRAAQYIQRVGLSDKSNSLVKKLSSGQQQKIQLGVATINRPSLLILDEPTKGLDPINRSLLFNLLKELQREGSTIIFTTHQMEEIERLGTDHVLIIKDGRKAAFGIPSELKSKYDAETLDDVFLKVYA